MNSAPEVIVIGESDADVRMAIDLATRVLDVEPKLLDGYLTWSGVLGGRGSHWKDIGDLLDQAEKKGIKFPRYRSRGSTPLKADGAATKKFLNLIDQLQHKQQRAIAAVIFIRDLDNQPERREGINQARQGHGNPSLAIVIGTADRNREAWVLNGFEAQSPQEQQVLKDIVKDLTFDPCLEAHRLQSLSKTDPDRRRNPKHVLEQLTGGDQNREQSCWQDTDLVVLRKRGTETGLTDYLDEVKKHLSPMITSG